MKFNANELFAQGPVEDYKLTHNPRLGLRCRYPVAFKAKLVAEYLNTRSANTHTLAQKYDVPPANIGRWVRAVRRALSSKEV